jgi:hypothetical protein
MHLELDIFQVSVNSGLLPAVNLHFEHFYWHHLRCGYQVFNCWPAYRILFHRKGEKLIQVFLVIFSLVIAYHYRQIFAFVSIYVILNDLFTAIA